VSKPGATSSNMRKEEKRKKRKAKKEEGGGEDLTKSAWMSPLSSLTQEKEGKGKKEGTVPR